VLSKIRKSNSFQRSTLPVHATAQGQAFPCLRTPQAAEDATEIADWSAGIGWDVTYQQVTRGEFSGSFHASTRTGLVLHYHYAEPSVIIRGCAPRGMFALAVSEVALTPPIFQGYRLTASQVITMHPGSDAVLRSPERTGVSSVSIPADRLDQALLTYGSRPLSQLGQRAWAWDFTAARASTIHTLIRRAISMVAEVDACTGSLAEIEKLEDGLIQTIAFGLLEGTSAGPSTVARRNRTRYVRRACDYVESHLHDGINAEALANACGVSLRTLEYAFADVLNIRLHEYIKGRRLNAARHDLMRCQSLGLSVSRVALDYGFSHLSLFAKSYCNFFGELPSDTLRSHRT
jgi:AraC family transcriptional regulator, ethanolamine operon transcriptional activator